MAPKFRILAGGLQMLFRSTVLDELVGFKNNDLIHSEEDCPATYLQRTMAGFLL